jgi:hypothetical protein
MSKIPIPAAYCYTTKFNNKVLSFERIPEHMRFDYTNEIPLFTLDAIRNAANTQPEKRK